MTSRQKKIWDLFTEHKTMTSGQIAGLLHISDRTVRTDIREINELMKKEVIKARKGQGYYLELQDGEEVFPLQSGRDIEWNLVRRVLFEEKVPYLELADELYISDTFLSKIVNRINHTMNQRYGHGCIRKKAGFLLLELDEEEKRDYYHVYVTQRNVNRYFQLEEYQPFFESIKLDQVKELLIPVIALEQKRLYDTTIMRLLISVAILAERVNAGFLLPGEGTSFHRPANCKKGPAAGSLPAPEYRLPSDTPAGRVLKGLELILKLPFSSGEYLYLEHMLRNDFYYIHEGNPDKAKELLQRILIEINVEYGFDFSVNEKFCREMEAQLHGTMMRISNRQWAVNPALFRIKAKYPLEYDIAVFFADRLKGLYKTWVSEDEIGQFAIHFIWAMEQNLGATDQKVILINPYGKQIKDLIEKRLGEIGEYRLSISHVYSIFDYPMDMPKEASVVLTTVPLPAQPHDLPVVLCKNFLDYHEKEKLMTIIKENQVSSVKNYFRTLFKPSLFFMDMEFESKEAAITFLCERLHHQGYVDEGFYDSVIQRENLAPTAFEPGFAFVHAMENTARRTAICTCILKNKLPWGEFQVKIIFLFALASAWNHTMIPVYNVMIDHLFQSNTIHKLGKKKDLKAFVDLLL